MLLLTIEGFQHAGTPTINKEILSAVAPDLPVTIIVLILEHIAISKSFGRINNYVINPSQELVAVGFTNLFGPFLVSIVIRTTYYNTNTVRGPTQPPGHSRAQRSNRKQVFARPWLEYSLPSSFCLPYMR